MTDSVSSDPEPVVVWLWDAGRHLGVARREQEATEAAEEHISEAGTATVEMARLAYDSDLLRVHERTGVGVAGTVRDGQVSWMPLTRAA